MRKHRHGFTLVEVAIVLAVLAVVSYAGQQMFDQLNRSYRRAIAISDLKTQSLAAVTKIQNIARDSKAIVIDPDQRGAQTAQTHLRWEGDTVTSVNVGRSTKILDNVRHLSFHRRAGVVYLTLDVELLGNKNVHYRTVTPLTGDPR